MAVVWALAACAIRPGKCPSTVLEPARASAGGVALSCAQTIVLDGVAYDAWCAGIERDRIGAVIARAEDGGERHTFRQIVGIPTAEAVASRYEVPGAVDQRRFDRECGRWQFAPARSFPGPDALRIARAVVDERFLDALTGYGLVTRNLPGGNGSANLGR